jgi:hypothetical protein
MANIKQGAWVKNGDLTDLPNIINGNIRDRSVEAWGIHTLLRALAGTAMATK